jgi:hypothetical protein
MKKRVLSIFIILFFSAVLLAAETKFILTLHGNYFETVANTFTSQTKKAEFFAEGKAAITVSRNLYIWGSYGTFPIDDNWTEWSNKSAFETDINVGRVLHKKILSGGLGYFIGYFKPGEFAIKAEAGICSITNNIGVTYTNSNSQTEIRSESEKQSGIGITANLGVTYGFYKSFFAEISGGYAYAGNKKDSVTSSLGGFCLSLGLGIEL